MYKAVRNGHYDLLKWMHDQGCPHDNRVCSEAAECGDLELLIWARENGYFWDATTCINVAGGGHMELLQWAYENGCPMDDRAGDRAAQRGDLNMLKWFHEKGRLSGLWTSACAAASGNLELLQWIQANGYPWSRFTCRFAAEAGRSFSSGPGGMAVHGKRALAPQPHGEEILRANGCKWDERTLSIAIRYGHFDLVKWLHANRCPMNEWAASTAASGRFECSSGCTPTAACWLI